jgi:hypothetical protein
MPSLYAKGYVMIVSEGAANAVKMAIGVGVLNKVFKKK